MDILEETLLYYNNNLTNVITKEELDDDTQLRFTLLDMQLFAELYYKQKLDVEKILNNDTASVIEWNSVNEILPSDHQDVLVYYYGNRNSKHWPDLQFMKQSSFYDGCFECNEEVTYWANLPKPPFA